MVNLGLRRKEKANVPAQDRDAIEFHPRTHGNHRLHNNGSWNPVLWSYGTKSCLGGYRYNIPVFVALKLSATLCISFTYILAIRILNTADKTTRGFRVSNILVKAAYAGLVVFLAIVVVNNLTVLLS